MLPWLGGGAQTWTEVSRGLADRGVRCVALDLPGFGEASDVAGYDIAAMTRAVAETLRQLRAGAPDVSGMRETLAKPWVLAGHSMGGIVATLLARRALDGEPGLEGLRGLVLVSPSPPGPEPMKESKRAEMLSTLGESTGKPVEDRKRAGAMIDSNTGKVPLSPAIRERAVTELLRMNRTAFRYWLEHGSKEDWQQQIGKLPLPALVFAGSEEDALGEEAQRRYTLPALPQGTLVVLGGAGHLSPLEQPGELIEHITQFLTGLGLELPVPQAAPGSAFTGLMESGHTSPTTNAVMSRRLADAQHWNAQPRLFSLAEFRTLRALVGRVVPEAGFDIAAGLDADLAEAKGDGWRFATLPLDHEAWRHGLLSLDHAATAAHGVSFVALHAEQQDEVLLRAADGDLGPGLLSTVGGAFHLGKSRDLLDAGQMKQWFEDVRAECARRYMADPRTMDRIGFTGFADDLGFTQIQLGQREEFER